MTDNVLILLLIQFMYICSGCIHDVNLLISLLEAFDLESHVLVLILISK